MIEYHFDCMRLRSGLASITLFFSMTTWLIAAEARFNEVQVIGTHNSYHIAPDESLLRVIEKTNPEGAKSLQYTRRPLTEQFSAGIRQIELDLFADPRGGLFAEPKGNKIATEQGLPIGPNHDPTGALRKPGFKVLHIPDIDFRSTVLTLREGLTQIRDWSEAHPRHFPIFVLLELKDEAAGQNLQVSYSDFNAVQGQPVPHQVNIKSQAERKNIVIDLKYSRVELNQTVEMPFSVPKRFTVKN